MEVKKTLKLALINYPEIYPNALTVYDHWFCVVGNGYKWLNGELVEKDFGYKKAKTLKKAIKNRLNHYLIEDYGENGLMEDFKNLSNHTMISHNKTIIKYVNRIFNYKNSMKNFEIPTEKDDKIYKISPFTFYPICEYSLICNLPNDIKPDWLEASEKMYNILLEHIDLVEDENNLLPGVGERIKELKNKQ